MIKQMKFTNVPTNTPFNDGIRAKYSHIPKLVSPTKAQVMNAYKGTLISNKHAINGTNIIGDQKLAEKITKSTT